MFSGVSFPWKPSVPKSCWFPTPTVSCHKLRIIWRNVRPLTSPSICGSVYSWILYTVKESLEYFRSRFGSLCKSDRHYKKHILIRRFHKELNDLYSPSSTVRLIKSRRMRWVGHVARMEEGRGVHKVLVGKPGGKRPLGRPRRRWEDNIEINLQ